MAKFRRGLDPPSDPHKFCLKSEIPKEPECRHIGGSWGVFGPTLALFRPKQAFVGQNRAKYPPKTPPKPVVVFFGEKMATGPPPAQEGRWGVKKFRT